MHFFKSVASMPRAQHGTCCAILRRRHVHASASSPARKKSAGWAKRSVPTISRESLREWWARCALSSLRCPKRRVAYPSNTASAPFTASALSVTVFSSEPACTVMFSAKNRATVT